MEQSTSKEEIKPPAESVNGHGLSSMALNDNKAGMEGLDKEKINQIIFEASKGSKFYENERKKEEQLDMKIKEQQLHIQSMTPEAIEQGKIEADKILRDLEDTIDLSHIIVHVDMDAFYAAVEMRDDPSLKNKPMAVGGMGMLSTSNYIARRYGVRAAMPGFIGLKLCPDLVLVKTNFDKYTAVSKQIREIFSLYDPNFSPMSLDEAYLDFTKHLHERMNSPPGDRTLILRCEDDIVKEKTDMTESSESERQEKCTCDLNDVLRPQVLALCEERGGDCSFYNKEDTEDSSSDFSTIRSSPCPECHRELPKFVCKVYGTSTEDAVLEMRNRIQQRTQLTASAGIAPNRLIAKVCSDMKKPDGQYRIHPDRQEIADFISSLPIRKISGIGKVSEKMLRGLGVSTCRDLYHQRGLLYHCFSSTSLHYFMRVSLGIGSTTVERDGERKSLSTEQTFNEINTEEDLMNKCQELCQALAQDMQAEQILGKTVTLKLKSVNFEVKTRSHSLAHACRDEKIIFSAARQLLKTEIQAEAPRPLRLRLMGLRMSRLVPQAKSRSVMDMFLKHNSQAISSSQSQSQVPIPSDEEVEEDFNAPFDDTFHSILAKSGASSNKKFPIQESSRSNLSLGPGFFTQNESSKEQNICAMTKTKGSPASFFEAKRQNLNTYSTSANVNPHSQRQETEFNNEFYDLTQETTERTSETYKSSSIDVINNQTVSEKLPPNELAQDKDEVDSVPQESRMIQCPVCFHQRKDWPLDLFNTHMDLCLSKQTIKTILQEQEGTGSSSHTTDRRKRGNPENSATSHHKKLKGEHNQPSLLAFFNK